MNSCNVVGFVSSNGVALCCNCADENSNNNSPIFADSEWDSIPNCDVCDVELNVNLIVVGD